MNTFAALLIGLVFGLAPTPSIATSDTQMNELIKEIIVAAKGRGDVCDVAPDLVEKPYAQALGNYLTQLELTDLRAAVVRPWPKQEFDALRIGLEIMPPDKYIELLNSVLTTRPISIESAKLLLHPFVRYNHLLKDNWQHPEVQRLVLTAMKIFASDPIMIAYLTALRSGDAKKQIDEYRKNSGDQVSPPITLAGSDIKSVASVNTTSIRTGGVPVKSKADGQNESDQISGHPLAESNSWLIWAVIIAAAIGLLWLLLKGRK